MNAPPPSPSPGAPPQEPGTPVVPPTMVVRARPRRGRPKPLKKRIKHGAAYVVFRMVWVVLTHLPERVLHAGARGLGWLLCRTPVYQAALANIRLAYGSASPSERYPTAEDLAQGCMHHYALMVAEALLLDRWTPAGLDRATIPKAMLDLGLSITRRGRGLVVATGHIGPWEMLGRGLALLGFDVWTLARAPFDGRVATWLEQWRARGGVHIVNRGSHSGMRAAKQHVLTGGCLGALVDVDTDVKSAFVPFFGRLARTPTAAADLALKLGTPLVVLWSWRERFGHYSGSMEQIPVLNTGNAQQDAVEMTRQITAVLEKAIRAHPEQWIWSHRRWKTPPPATAALPAEPPQDPAA